MSRTTTAHLMVLVLIVHATPKEPVRGNIIFLERANITSCLNGAINGTAVADNGLMTFNFQQKDNTYIAFQIPKCVFASKMAEDLMHQVDFSETIESYRRRYREYFIVAVDGAYRLFQQNLTLITALPTHDIVNSDTNILGRSINVTASREKLYVNASLAHSILRGEGQECQMFQGDRVLFPITTTCNVQNFSARPGAHFYLSITDSFLSLRLSKDEDSDILILFGDLRSVDLKAPYNRAMFTLRQTSKHDLMIVSKLVTVKKHYLYVTFQNFLNNVLSINYYNLSALYEIFDKAAVNTLLRDLCGKATQSTHELIFMYAMILYTATQSTRNEHLLSVEEFLERQTKLITARDFITRCFGKPTNRPDFNLAGEVANISLEYNALYKNMNPSSVLNAMYIVGETGNNPIIPREALETLAQHAVRINREAMLSSISPDDRAFLYLLNEVIHRTERLQDLRELILVSQTGSCSPKELYQWADHVYLGSGLTIRNLYTPCAGSGRRDYTRERMDSLFRLSFSSKINTATLENMIHHFQPSNMKTFKQLACISEEERYAAVTLPESTYVISSKYLVQGMMYPVSNTVVGTPLIVTAVPKREECTLTNVLYNPAVIPVLKNITSTERCEYCESVLVEYDELHGLINLIYLHDNSDLSLLTNVDNDILVTSSRIHYLMLTRNGTVLEVTEVLVDINETSVLLIAVYVIFAIVTLFGLYRIFKFL